MMLSDRKKMIYLRTFIITFNQTPGIILILQPSSRVNAMTPEEEARQPIDGLFEAAS